MNADLLKLPWEIQVSLACGYAAYVVAFTGLRSRHQTIDVLLITVVFSLVATATLWLLADLGALWRNGAALVVSLVCGLGWRLVGRPLASKILRATNATWADDAPSALATLSENTSHFATQVAVLLDDGTWLECRDTSIFSDAPFSPCVIGPSGDVAMYITHEQKQGDIVREYSTVRDTHYGDRITYLPAARIKRMTIRLKKCA